MISMMTEISKIFQGTTKECHCGSQSYLHSSRGDHIDDVIDTDFSLIDNDSIDIYSRSEMPNEDYTDTVYGSKEEYNTLVYDIDQNSNENSGEISYIIQEDSDSDSKSN